MSTDNRRGLFRGDDAATAPECLYVDILQFQTHILGNNLTAR